MQQDVIGHTLTPWKSADTVAKKKSFRRLSFFKPSSSIEEEKHSVTPVLTTNTMNKEYDPETGNKIINNFMIIKEIGRGMHGKVKLAEDLDTGELVAIKIVDKQSRRRQLGYSALRAKNNSSVYDNESEQKIRREIAILKKCAHPHVVRLKEVIDDPASRKIYLALEYMEGGEILWRDEENNNKPVLLMAEARSIFRDVVGGLDYLHYQGIIHRDIKPANLLWTRDHTVKISDFGVSYFNQHLVGSNNAYNEEMDRELAETAGTPAFFAPELCSSIEINQHDDRHITKAIDVWALGVTLYCLIYGQCPFTASTEFELFDMIPTAPLVFPTEDEIGFSTPDSLKDLLQGLLTKDPDHRMTLAQVKQHAWVLQDLEDVEGWWKEADPTRYKTVQVTEEDVSRAFTLMDRLKRSIRRISSSFSNLTQGFARHHHRPALTAPTTSSSLSSSSSLSLLSMTAEPHPTLQQQQQQQQQQQHSKDDNGGWIPTSFTQMTLHHPASSSSEESLRESRTAAVPNTLYPHPFQIDRNDSSGSSMSGLVVTFSRAKTASDTNKKSA